MMMLEELIEKCLRYPSPDNAQCFSFRILDQSQFEIIHDADLSRHRLNMAQIPIFLALGGLLETASLVTAQSGMSLHPEMLFSATDDLNKTRAWVRIKLTPDAKIKSDPLVEALDKRFTDRRLFLKQPLPPEKILELKQISERSEKIKFIYQNKLHPNMLEKFLIIEEEIWKDSPLAADILNWIRFTRKSAETTRDGLSWPTLGLSLFQKPWLALFRRFPVIYAMAVKLARIFHKCCVI